MSSGPNLVILSVGNTRTCVARVADGAIESTERFTNEDTAAIVGAASGDWKATEPLDRPAIVLATVNEPVAGRLRSALADQLGVPIYEVGDDLPVPIGRRLDPETITGADRLLNAAAAFATVEQACIIVDAGTAVTVDFVDGEGTFHGGAIAPGAAMQLRAMHEATDALPELEFRRPDDEAFGRSTGEAMLIGVYHGIRGMVWKIVERYAEAYGAFPMVVATGGDAETLFADDELVDRIVPDLALQGIVAAARHALTSSDESS
ncbi:MAG: type III pantothenate kinase [Phycisphaerales bacterium]